MKLSSSIVAGGEARTSRLGWSLFAVLYIVIAYVVLTTMVAGLPSDSPFVDPNAAISFPSLTMAQAIKASIPMVVVMVAMFGTLGWLSWRQGRMHRALIVAIGMLFTGVVDPVANWATFASLTPAAPHLPTGLPWFGVAPLAEPALSLLGGYSAYYVLTGLLFYWLTKKLVLSWAGRKHGAPGTRRLHCSSAPGYYAYRLTV